MGLSLGLGSLGKVGDAGFQAYLQRVRRAIAQGEDLATALGESRFFDGWTLGLIRLSEYSGALPEMLDRLAVQAEKQQRYNQLERSARLAAIASIWCLLVLMVAIFKRNPSGFLNPIFWINGFGLGLLLFSISWLMCRFPGLGLQRLLAKLPYIKKITQARSMLRFAEIALPLSCGIPLLTALELLRDRISDWQLAASLASISRKIRNGNTFSNSLEGNFPPIAIQMIRTGEETGNLDTALQNITDYYEGELRRNLQQLQSFLQPLSVVSFGSLVVILGVRVITQVLSISS